VVTWISVPPTGIFTEKGPSKRCLGIRSVAGALPLALTPPWPGTGPFGKPNAIERFSCDVWVICMPPPIAVMANCSGTKTCPRRIAQLPDLWNLRAPAPTARARGQAQSAIRTVPKVGHRFHRPDHEPSCS
jgi:hypothetical protein